MATWVAGSKLTSSDGSLSIKPAVNGGYNVILGTTPGTTGMNAISLNGNPDQDTRVLPNSSGVVNFSTPAGSGISLASTGPSAPSPYDLVIENTGVLGVVVGGTTPTPVGPASNGGITLTPGPGVALTAGTNAVTISNGGLISMKANGGSAIGPDGTGAFNLTSGTGITLTAGSNAITIASTAASSNPTVYEDTAMTAYLQGTTGAPSYASNNTQITCAHPTWNTDGNNPYSDPSFLYFPAFSGAVAGRTYYGSWDLSLDATLVFTGAIQTVPSVVVGYFPGTAVAANSSTSQFWGAYKPVTVNDAFSASLSFSGPLDCVTAPTGPGGATGPCFKIGVQTLQIQVSRPPPGPPFYSSQIVVALGGYNDPITNLSGLIYGSAPT